MGVERAHVERVAENREAAVVRAAADDQRRIQRVAVDPEDAAVLAPSATTSFSRCVRYMTPSTTNGVVCQLPATAAWYIHFNSRFLAFAGVICVSPLWR
jgi:hypothetical protein